MAVTLNKKATTMTRADLKQSGLDDEVIDRLETLSEKYPFAEFLDSDAEWQRLVFLKWLRDSGRFEG
ncbi:MAG: hypothetical protein WBW04_11715 [Nitrolancea sp.]